ncbi:right-handed parallel beta-helix repeat-containing protein [Jannaschia formosa]|uniref:right-handed parallel beta-helix repeat-containing protein n=1 Tax=Jannaschia formosa TaxID=2259592 RepID=UPI000E1B9DE4|nr:right-handed parallel beta-helix repeat-containing protein [Jannaschia formosa]TFL16185.1 right-handed parallel beta-helix repeat-containing protein [Jannaschia formosa]
MWLERFLLAAVAALVLTAGAVAQHGGGATSAPSAPAAATVSVGDLRLGLLQAALHVGPEGHDAIMAAQPDEAASAIFLRSGVATLAGLHAAVQDTELAAGLRRTGEDGVFVATRPIVILQGASLKLVPGEELQLDAREGALLLSFGDLGIEGARVVAIGTDDEAPGAFRPFIASLGPATLTLTEAELSGLGFEGGPMTSGLAHVVRGLIQSREPLRLHDARLLDIHGATIIGGEGLEVLRAAFLGARGTALSVKSVASVRVEDSRFENGSGPYAIRIAEAGDAVALRRNSLLDGRHGGIRIEEGTFGARLSDNTILGFSGTAIALAEGAGCLRLDANLVRDNGGDGISARHTGSLVIDGNIVTGNGGAAISLSTPAPRAELLVSGNRIAGNRTGLRGVMLGALRLAGNDLSGQSPRILSGDLSQVVPALLRASRDEPADLQIRHVRAWPAETKLPEAAESLAHARCGEAGAF